MGNYRFSSKMRRGVYSWLLSAVIYTLLLLGLPAASFAQETDMPLASVPSEQDAKAASEELDTRIQLKDSLLSLGQTLEARRTRLGELSDQLQKTEDEAEQTEFQGEIDKLTAEITQAEGEIEIVVLGLLSREFTEIGEEQNQTDKFDLGTEVGAIFQPLIVSLERATEPSRRMEQLRQLSKQTNRKQEIANATLEHIQQFRLENVKYPEYLEQRLTGYEENWGTRLQESIDLGNALTEQLDAAERAKGNTLTRFAEDFGNFVINRGANLILALGGGLGFLILCQFLRIGLANVYRQKRTGVVSAPVRIIGMLISMIGIVGAFVIAITIFNIRHDWLMLAMSLLLALAISWSFVRALPTMMEETRVLLNLGSVREGERTIVNGLPYRIERLSLYSKLVNPALNGGSLIFPVREMINMHSRPVIEGEAWFPTEIGEWIVRDGKHYEITNQSPEHVILKRPGGSEDFVPVQEFLDTLFETLSDGYRRSHIIGLSYNHLDIASDVIPGILSKAVRKRVAARIDTDSILEIETRLVELGSSSLDFKILVDVGLGQGEHWEKIRTDIANGAIDACLENGWEIPFPQLVVHKPS